MDGIQMEPIGKYKADRNGSAKGKTSDSDFIPPFSFTLLPLFCRVGEKNLAMWKLE